MAPRKSQFKKFDNIIAKISDSIDSGKVSSTEIYEEIKNQLRENLSTVYKEWENSQFDPSFRFKLSGGLYGITETTLLHSATSYRKKKAACVPLIQCLLDKGANLNTRDSYNRTPLSRAVYTEEDKNKEVVKLLLDAGADPNAMDGDASDSRTTLSIACRYSDESLNVEIAKLLLKSGANVNEVVDNKGNTVLHKLVYQSFYILDKEQAFKAQLIDLIEFFIKYGANIYAENNGRHTPERAIENRLRSYSVNDKEFVTSIQKFLEKQKDSIEYHRKLFEVVEQNKDLRSLADIIANNGPISIRGIQVCSKVIPQILGIPGIKLVIKGTIAEGKVEQEFSQGTGWPVIEIEGDSPRYYNLFNKVISYFEDNSVVKNRLLKSDTLSYRMCYYIMCNAEAMKQELWGVSSTPTEVTKAEGGVTEGCVTRKESDKDAQDTVKQHGKKKTKGNAGEENRNEINDTSYTDNKPTLTGRSTFNSDAYSQKEAKDPPIFSRKQKIAIAIGVVTALTTALACYSLQLPTLAIVISTLIAGIGVYVISSKLYDVSICNGTGQQPGL
ncbi:MAG: ankyrin repeat domain-containing protein [Wolbachia sp.]